MLTKNVTYPSYPHYLFPPKYIPLALASHRPATNDNNDHSLTDYIDIVGTNVEHVYNPRNKDNNINNFLHMHQTSNDKDQSSDTEYKPGYFGNSFYHIKGKRLIQKKNFLTVIHPDISLFNQNVTERKKIW